MGESICAADGCTESIKVKSLRLCSKHYRKHRRAVAPRCTVEGCDQPRDSRGLCDSHNYRRRNGLQLDAPFPRAAGKTCTVDECGEPVLAKDLCQLHYNRRWRTGTTEPRPSAARVCSVEGCDDAHLAQDLCRKHYQRLQNTGTTDDRPSFIPSACSIAGCDSESLARGWCRRHYARWMRSGSPEFVERVQRHCSVDDCSRPYKGNGFCDLHLRRHRAGTPLDAFVRGEKPRLCSAEGCDRAYHSRGLCAHHYQRRYRKRNITHIQARVKAKREGITAEQRAARSAARAAHYQANRDRIRAQAHARYVLKYAEDPAPWRAAKARRRMRAVGTMSRTDIAVSEEYRRATVGDPCFYCGATGTTDVDHFFPLAKGGTDHWWNLRRACEPCNSRKWARCGTWFILKGRGEPRFAAALPEADSQHRRVAARADLVLEWGCPVG